MVLRARAPGQEAAEDPTWVCQTTALYEATTLLKWWDVRQYIRDVTTGNHTAWHMFKLLVAAGYRHFVGFGPGYRPKVAFYNWFQRLRGGEPFPVVPSRIKPGEQDTDRGPRPPAGRVGARCAPRRRSARRSRTDGFNRGMRYDMEMLKYSGKKYRVEMRVDRLINEQTGKMMEMKSPCIQLENVYCRAECTDRRLGLPAGVEYVLAGDLVEADGGAAKGGAAGQRGRGAVGEADQGIARFWYRSTRLCPHPIDTMSRSPSASMSVSWAPSWCSSPV